MPADDTGAPVRESLRDQIAHIIVRGVMEDDNVNGWEYPIADRIVELLAASPPDALPSADREALQHARDWIASNAPPSEARWMTAAIDNALAVLASPPERPEAPSEAGETFGEWAESA